MQGELSSPRPRSCKALKPLQGKEAHMEQIITIRDAALTYQARNGEVEALRRVTFTVAEGEFVSIVGPSGC